MYGPESYNSSYNTICKPTTEGIKQRDFGSNARLCIAFRII